MKVAIDRDSIKDQVWYSKLQFKPICPYRCRGVQWQKPAIYGLSYYCSNYHNIQTRVHLEE